MHNPPEIRGKDEKTKKLHKKIHTPRDLRQGGKKAGSLFPPLAIAINCFLFLLLALFHEGLAPLSSDDSHELREAEGGLILPIDFVVGEGQLGVVACQSAYMY